MNPKHEQVDLPDEALLLDGMEEAFVGKVSRFGAETVACYDYDKIIDILCRDMSVDEADEYFEFNIAGAWAGRYTPCFITRISDEPER